MDFKFEFLMSRLSWPQNSNWNMKFEFVASLIIFFSFKSLDFSQTLIMESNLNLESLANFPDKCILPCTKLLWLQGLNFEGFGFPSLATLISSKVNSAKTFEAKEKVQCSAVQWLVFWPWKDIWDFDSFFWLPDSNSVKQLLKFHSQSWTDTCNLCSP